MQASSGSAGIGAGSIRAGTTAIGISVVVPVYGCEACLRALHERVSAALSPLVSEWELILVNDASTDGAWPVIRQLAEGDARVKGINLSRNFGQHYAIAAGVDAASGDWLVVMDCDLQHPPEEIPKLYRKAQEGHQVVFGRRAHRKDGFWKRLSSRLYIGLLGYLTGIKLDASISNFSIVSRKVVRNLRRFGEHSRSHPLFVDWLGFSPAFIDLEHAERFAGETTYTFAKLVRFAIDNMVSFTDRPLRLSIRFGLFVSLFAGSYGLYLLLRYFVYLRPVEGWTSVMVSIYFVAGLLFANLGVLGLYVGKIFEETKGRPLYVVRDVLNLPEPE